MVTFRIESTSRWDALALTRKLPVTTGFSSNPTSITGTSASRSSKST
jgi:hypothetical protein